MPPYHIISPSRMQECLIALRTQENIPASIASLLAQLTEDMGTARKEIFAAAQEALTGSLAETREVSDQTLPFVLTLLLSHWAQEPDALWVLERSMSLSALADAFAMVERHDLRVAYVLMNNPTVLGDTPGDITPMDFLLEIAAGHPVSLWGASLHMMGMVPQDQIWFLTELDMLYAVEGLEVDALEPPWVKTPGGALNLNGACVLRVVQAPL